ncbi:MAG: hypothetical protein ACHQ1H_00110 [Nitrososphaerales archaeon]
MRRRSILLNRGISRLLIALIAIVIVVVLGAIATVTLSGSSTTSFTTSSSGVGITNTVIVATSTSLLTVTTSLQSTLFSTSPGSLTTTPAVNSTTSSPCTFNSGVKQISSAETLFISGCLTPFSTGSIGIAIVNQNGFTLSGTVTAEKGAKVTIGDNSQILFTQNDTTSANFNGLTLTPQIGDAVIIQNLAGENNSISAVLQFT